MQEIKCPNCGKIFTIKEEDYQSILTQIRDSEFEKELLKREKQLQENLDNAVKLTKAETSKALEEELNKKELEIKDLQNKLIVKDKEQELLINQAVTKKDEDISHLKTNCRVTSKTRR